MPLLQFVIMKQAADQRVGISFVAEAEDESEYGALVSRLVPDSMAAASGLFKGDRVLSLNGVAVSSAAEAAATIRGSLGDVYVVVERPAMADDQAEMEDHAGDAMRKLRGWFAEATTPRGGTKDRGLFSAVGQGMIRLMAPKHEHAAATKIGAHWRGFRTRALCFVWHWAATELQRTVRGRQVRSYVLPALRERADVERAFAAAQRAKQLAAEAEAARRQAEQEQYLRDCRATEEYMQAEAAAQADPAAKGGGTARIKKALSFGSKKKRNPNRLPLSENPRENQLEAAAGTPSKCDAATDSSRSNSTSGAHTPPPASPRDKTTPKQPPHTAPAKRSVRRTLSWTRRTSKHIEADTNSKQREIAL